MGSLKLEFLRKSFPDMTDREIAEALAKKEDYHVIVRYKSSWSKSGGYTSLGCCLLPSEVASYFSSPYCLDTEIIYDDGVIPLPILARRKDAKPHGWVRAGSSLQELMDQDKIEGGMRVITEKPDGSKDIKYVINFEKFLRPRCPPGNFFVFTLDNVPHIAAILSEILDEDAQKLKSILERGWSVFCAEFFSAYGYPLIHIGMGIVVGLVEGHKLKETGLRVAVAENLSNFAESNYQDWIIAVEAKKYTQVNVFGPEYSHIATFRLNIRPHVIKDMVAAVDAANTLYQSAPTDLSRFNEACPRFYEDFPDPFICSTKKDYRDLFRHLIS